MTLLVFAILLTSRTALAQEAAFRDADIAQLAAVIATEARRTNQVPSGFAFSYSDGQTVLITTANAFELLARTIIAWQRAPHNPDGNFPAAVTLQMPDLVGPAWAAAIEPERDGMVVAVATTELSEKTPYWLIAAESQNHKLMRALEMGKTKHTAFRLSAAQFMVAMAMLIDEAVKRKTDVPAAVAVPMVRSPREWNATQNPAVVRVMRTPPAPTVIPMSLRLLVNGIDPMRQEPVFEGGAAATPVYCGINRLEIAGFGPVAKIRVMMGKTVLELLDGPGPHTLMVDTLPFADEVHILAVTAIDAEDKTTSYVLSFPIRNGRASGHNPLQRDVEVTPVSE